MTAPAIILVRPQLGMNIGMAARAMGNFALDQLRLVSPRDGWPNPEAGPPAAGADHVLEATTVHESVAEALADCALTFATTVRPRDMPKPVVTPREAAAMIRAAAARGQKAGILFGPERSGLTADDLAPISTIVTCPINPGHGSLNLAQAVLLLGYEWFQAGDPETPQPLQHEPAPHGEVAGLIAHLDSALEEAGYYHVPDRTPATRRTLAQLLTRPQFSAEEVRTLRGMIRALAEGRRKKRA
ncbi:RNA methyltransferase [Sandaracinobacter neustonicus]|uniref:RNA methyltransferase n=1 Tax=Sandaracinobacter neustonicus TaxID=1715348 RepID=A0A501XJU1_9SPHN|nr:RNA methyltransferase [Sandaracinobacter neustonicus]TPE60534.1 RNA methyltransferase [Sandaracinobacter neustonicus]